MALINVSVGEPQSFPLARLSVKSCRRRGDCRDTGNADSEKSMKFLVLKLQQSRNVPSEPRFLPFFFLRHFSHLPELHQRTHFEAIHAAPPCDRFYHKSLTP